MLLELRLYNRLYDFLVTNDYLINARFLVLVETEANYIARAEVIIIKIFAQLLFSTFIIGIASPNLEFNDILIAKIVDYDICACHITCLRFTIVVADSVYYRSQISEKNYSAIALKEFSVLHRIIYLIKMPDETFKQLQKFI